jgi:hypothetical protein
MSYPDYEVGYGKPPKHTQFKKGQCANPMGRGARKPLLEKAVFRKFLSDNVRYITRGSSKKASRLELLVRKQVAGALKGDVGSAMSLLKMHSRFSGAMGSDVTYITFTGGIRAREEDGWRKVSD